MELAKQWVEEWKKEGINVMLISMPSIKPFDKDCIDKLIVKKIPIFTIEEHNIIGGLGSAVAEIIAESGQSINFKRIGINDTFSHHVGNHTYQREKFGLLKKPNFSKE